MTVRQPHPIEVRSYEILRSRVDLSPMPPLWRAVAERVIHATADPAAARMARAAGITRSAAAVRLSYAEVGPGAVWAVGSSPEAISEIIARRVSPALVIGMPVGFVGACEAKEALRASGLPQLSNVSEKGGSAVAAAAVDALLYSDEAGSR